jgi:hypothetical protein
MTEIILMAHVLFGMLCIVGGVWLFVDVLHANEANQSRIRTMSMAVAILMWLAYLVGGYWYLTFYYVDKAIILKGPWPFAHSFFMEMKEHVAIMLLLLVTYLPIAAANNTAVNKGARKLVLWIVGFIVLIGIAIDGAGAVIGIGAKVGLMAIKG